MMSPESSRSCDGGSKRADVLGRGSALEIKICNLPERLEVVRRVEELLALADRIETRDAKVFAQVDALTPAILAKAFRGELAPQDPSDEPASVLLERIQSAMK